MKAIGEVALGIAVLALIPLASSNRFRGEEDAASQRQGYRLFGLGENRRTEQPTKTDRPLVFAIDTPVSAMDGSVGGFLASCEPVYDFEDPADSYFTAWNLEKKAREGKWLSSEERLKLLAEAYSYIEGVALFTPEWKPSLAKRMKKKIGVGVQDALQTEQVGVQNGIVETPDFESVRKGAVRLLGPSPNDESNRSSELSGDLHEYSYGSAWKVSLRD